MMQIQLDWKTEFFFSKRKFLGFFVFILAPTERDFLLGSLELIFKVLDHYRIPKGCEGRNSQMVVASHKSAVSRMFFNPLKRKSPIALAH